MLGIFDRSYVFGHGVNSRKSRIHFLSFNIISFFVELQKVEVVIDFEEIIDRKRNIFRPNIFQNTNQNTTDISMI